MKKTKKFTILHSNDMHGDFLSDDKKEKGKLVGGLSLLSGYINKVREEEKNVFFVIAGDMLQGSLIDSEFKGVSTMELMNYLSPDVVSLGNHEVDYGLPHLLFLEKVANFPIVNANLYIKKYNKRMMLPYKIIKKDGFDVLFTGILTEKTMDSIKQDSLIGSFVSLREASNEVGKICNTYKNDDIDLTIVLSHIGYESDLKLAALLKEEWGVDMILGGHSHTILEKPGKVNNILIAQAGVGTDQIGRFDIVVDDDTNKIIEYKWELVEINNITAKPDKELEKFINSFQKIVNKKYNTLFCRLQKKLTHPKREIETSLGNLISDAFSEVAQCDVMFVGSGSIRSKKLGPLVTLRDITKCFPYDDSLIRFKITGRMLRKIFKHIMKKENRNGEGECYQVNKNVHAVYNDAKARLSKFEIKGKKVELNKKYTICLQGFHYKNCTEYLNITEEELLSVGASKVVSTSAKQVLEEYLRNNQNIDSNLEKRLVYR